MAPAVHFLPSRIGFTLTEPRPPKGSKKKENQEARSLACKQAAHKLWTNHSRPAVNRVEVIPEEFKVSLALCSTSLSLLSALIEIVRSTNWKLRSIRLRGQDYPLPNIISELQSMQMISVSCGQKSRISSARRRNSDTVTSRSLIGWPQW